jgi:cytochrome c-type biogenesis protein CcmH/NrfG
VLDQKEDFPEVWFGLGEINAAQGELDEAISAYRTAIEQKPNFAGPWHSLGQIYLARDQHEAAV